MFNWSGNFTFPKLTDVINVSDPANIQWMDIFTYIWIVFLGNWFFGMVIGVIGVALYIKFDKPVPVIVFYIVMALLFQAVLPGILLTIIGILSGFAIGILLYQVLISKGE